MASLSDTKLSLSLGLASLEKSPTPEKEQEKNHPLLDLNLAPGEQSFVKNSLSDDREMNNENSGSRKRLRLSKEQSSILEEFFKQPGKRNSEQKNRLASELKITVQQVESWFQNHRSRSKQETTKKTCEEQAAKIEWLERELEMAKRANFAVPVNEHGDYECPNCGHNLSKVKDYLSNMEE